MADPFRDVLEFHIAMAPGHIGKTMGMPEPYLGEYRAELMIEEMSEFLVSLAEKDFINIQKELVDILYVTIGTMITFGVDPASVWDEVHRSNMAKQGGLLRADGKRMKPLGWIPPDIEGIIRALRS